MGKDLPCRNQTRHWDHTKEQQGGIVDAGPFSDMTVINTGKTTQNYIKTLGSSPKQTEVTGGSVLENGISKE